MAIVDPIELCLEELDDPNAIEPYLRCVAVAGGGPGLAFSAAGEVLWCLNDDAVAELWVSRDHKLIFYRTRTAGIVSLSRGERHLELPLGKPVVVLDGDIAHVASRRFRIFVHGTATLVGPPERLRIRRTQGLAVGVALTLGALTTGCKQGATGDAMRADNGSPAVSLSASSLAPTIGEAPGADATSSANGPRDFEDAHAAVDASGVTDAATMKRQKTRPIEIRTHPPAPRRPPPNGLDL